MDSTKLHHLPLDIDCYYKINRVVIMAFIADGKLTVASNPLLTKDSPIRRLL